MEKLENALVKYIWLVIIVLSLPAIWALLVPGYYGASDDLHVAWLFEMDRTLKFGQFPPRFIPDLSYQFGYPLFNFVFPLPFYISEIFHLVGLSLVDSVKAIFLISVPLSMFWMYKLVKLFTNETLSLAAAVLYVYTPYRATDLYVRGAIGEIVGFAFLPLICLAVLKIAKTKTWNRKWVGIGGLGIGALILTHDIMAYMFFPLIALLGVAMLFGVQKKLSVFSALVAMGLLGLLASSYFWLPAIADSPLMKYDTVFNFQDHYPTLKQLVTPYWGYGASVAGPYDGMSFFMGVFNWVAVIFGLPLLILFRKKFDTSEKVIITWGYIVLLFAIFMMNFRSADLWKMLPEVPYFQFPWRFLIITTFVTPLFFIAFGKLKYSKQIGMALLLIIIGINAFQFRPHDFLGRTDAYYLNRYVPFPIASEDYKQTQEEYLRLSKNTLKRPDEIVPEIQSIGPSITSSETANPFHVIINTSTYVSTNILYHKYVFPGWNASLDGKPLEIKSSKPYGQISFTIPPGVHTTKIDFVETPLKMVLDITSLVSILAAIFLITRKKFNWRLRS